MKPTDGLTRGTEVRNLGHPLQMPVGDGVLGHVLNVLGEPLAGTALLGATIVLGGIWLSQGGSLPALPWNRGARAPATGAAPA